MNDKLAEFYQITAAITALLPSNQREYERKMSKKIEKNELALQQDKSRVVLESALDVLVERRDKLRFEIEQLTAERETKEKLVEERRIQRQQCLVKSSQKDEEKKKRLEKIKSECEIFGHLMRFGIENIESGKPRGVVFKSKSVAYCDLDEVTTLSDGKENLCDPQTQYSRLDKIYSLFDVSEQWTHLL